MNKIYRGICEKLDRSITDTEDGNIELEKYSPAGENFIISVGGEAQIGGDAEISGKARIGGTAHISGDSQVGNMAYITDDKAIL